MDSQAKYKEKSSGSFVLKDGIVFGLRPAVRVNCTTLGDQDKHYAFLQRDGDVEDERKRRLYAAQAFCSTVPLRGTVEMELELVHDDDFNLCGIGYEMSVGVASCPKIVDWKAAYNGSHTVTRIMWHRGYRLVTSLGTNPYGDVNLCHVCDRDRIGIQVKNSGELTFSFNGKSQGVAAMNVYDSDKDLYILVDVKKCDYALRIKKAGR